MLYDEDGNAYVEPPIIPTEQHVFNVVKDYKRMFIEFHRMKKREKKHLDALDKANKTVQWQHNRIVELTDVVRHCFKYMKRHGVIPSPFLQDFVKRRPREFPDIEQK